MDEPHSYEPKVIIDDRGVFVPAIQEQDIPFPAIKRVYHIKNHGRVIRGFHFHQKEWKMFTVVHGSAKFVAIKQVDEENDEQVYTMYSSDRKPNVVVIPPGFFNGWVSLEEDTVLVCASSASFEESKEDDARVDPMKFGDVWAVKPR